MKTARWVITLALFVLNVSVARATRFNVDDPSGSGPVTNITSNQFVTDPSGTFDLTGTYTGPPIYSLELVVPGPSIVGTLSCASNVFLVTIVQPHGSNPGVCFFNSTTSLGLDKLFPPDLNGSDDPGGVYDCSWRDLDDCIGIRTGSLIDLGIPSNDPGTPNSALDLAANGAAPLPFDEAGTGQLLLLGLAGFLVAGWGLSRTPAAWQQTG